MVSANKQKKEMGKDRRGSKQWICSGRRSRIRRQKVLEGVERYANEGRRETNEKFDELQLGVANQRCALTTVDNNFSRRKS